VTPQARLEAAFAPEVVAALERLVREEVEARVAVYRKPWLSVSETAEYLGCTEKAVRGRIDRGTLPVTHIAGNVLIHRVTLDEELERNRDWPGPRRRARVDWGGSGNESGRHRADGPPHGHRGGKPR
jgi:excisionase family DNA binding protein